MADGDVVLWDNVAVAYQADDGNVYTQALPTFYQEQAALGYALATAPQLASKRHLPKSFQKRSWLVWNAADHTQRARVTVGTNAAYIAAVINTTTVKVKYRGYELQMVVYAWEGERSRPGITDTAKQAALPA